MEDYVMAILFNLKFNVLISMLGLATYLVNYFILKLKKEYKGIHFKMLLFLFLVPCFNLTFLIFNSIMFFVYKSSYRVVKIKNAHHSRSVKA